MKKIFILGIFMTMMGAITSCQKEYEPDQELMKIDVVSVTADTVQYGLAHTRIVMTITFRVRAMTSDAVHIPATAINLNTGTEQYPDVPKGTSIVYWIYNQNGVIQNFNGSTVITPLGVVPKDSNQNYVISIGADQEFKLTWNFDPTATDSYAMDFQQLPYNKDGSNKEYYYYYPKIHTPFQKSR